MNCSEIIPGRLWQGGSLDTVFHEDWLWKRGIDMVVNLCGDPPVSDVPSGRLFSELRWEIVDGPDLPDLSDLYEVVGRVEAAIRMGKRVLVHCAAGQNRSGLVCALAVSRFFPERGAALTEFVRARRPGALSNRAFAEFVEKIP